MSVNFMTVRINFSDLVIHVGTKLSLHHSLIIRDQMYKCLHKGWTTSGWTYNTIKYGIKVVNSFISYAKETKDVAIIKHIAKMCKMIDDMIEIVIYQYKSFDTPIKLDKLCLLANEMVQNSRNIKIEP